MKIRILTEGGSKIGFGHITRCTAILQAFREKGADAELIVNGDAAAAAILSKKGVKVLDWRKNLQKALGKGFNGVVVVDSYLANSVLCLKIAKSAKLSVFIDDYNRIRYPSGIVVNGSIGAESLPYPRIKTLEYCLGSGYIPLRKEFWACPPKTVRNRIGRILITFGGTDTAGLADRLAEFLGRRPGLKITVLSARKPLSAAAVRSRMLLSDVCVTACGQTTYELACCGVPAIGVGFADNQKINIEGWSKNKTLLFAGWKGDKDLFVKVQRLLSKMSFSKRLAMSRRGRQKVDGRGAQRIADIVSRAFIELTLPAFKLRPAAQRDREKIFKLSNSAVVRANSINTGKIKWPDHKRWFSAKIKDPHCCFLVAETHAGEFIGQLRYEVAGRDALVSVSVADMFRGRGLAAPLLTAGSEMLFKRFAGVKRITAYIRQENKASIKAFERAGYHFECLTLLNDIQMRRYAAKK
jgi:spore coat polysaccharide biosynthesis predicted glycosyltransferase SpsG/RimJ/RimL family protein N-acetyltransferase